jgi:diaminohydroxyphosphoribosylaminopyrimidine deaminase/5-amino-6-(5-phosphoribosylamino)uracil reductase
MRRAIEVARPHVGLTMPNPTVGCVLVLNDAIVAEAATAAGGRPHAEEQALEIAGEEARGCTAYVTLEPCGARSSGVPSCSELLLAAGVVRVVAASRDASPFASGRGLERLRESGVLVEVGLLADEAAFVLG